MNRYSLFATACIITLLTVAAFAQSDIIYTVPMYRLAKQGKHVYSTNQAEHDSLIETGGFSDEGIVGYVFTTSKVDVPVTPLYSYHDQKAQHMTGFGSARLLASQNLCCYAPIDTKSGAVPLYHCSIGPWGSADSLYTTSEKESFDLKNKGYGCFPVSGFYLWPNHYRSGFKGIPISTKKTDPRVGLVNMGCVPYNGSSKEYTCSTIRGYFLCESVRKDGSLPLTGCYTQLDLVAYQRIHDELIGLACKSLLGIGGEFLCQTKKGEDTCNRYLQSSKGLVTKCAGP